MAIKIKIDKEFLLKHRFWIMLGATVCLAFFGIFYLEFSDVAAKELADWKKLQGSTKFAKGSHNTKTIEAMALEAKKAKESEAKVWENNYKEQEHLFRWPQRMMSGRYEADEFDFFKGRFANNIVLERMPANVKAWPKDKDGELMHGQLVDLRPNWIVLKDRDGKEFTFYKTENVANVTLAGDTNKIIFPDMKKHKDKLIVVTYQVGKYFLDPLTFGEREVFRDAFKDQIHPLLKILDPLDERGKGVVQLRGWLYTEKGMPSNGTFVRYSNGPWGQDDDFSMSAWMAQEQLWVQAEIYRLIRAANDSISTFKYQGDDEWFKTDDFKAGKDWPGSEEKKKPFVFRNSYFELELTLDEASKLTFKIKNRLERQQSIDLQFRVQMNRGLAPEEIKISGPALKPKGDKDKKDIYTHTEPIKDGQRKGIYGVEQVLSWQTAAIKRLDHVYFGSNEAFGHRQAGEPLVSFAQKDAAPPAVVDKKESPVVIGKKAKGDTVKPKPAPGKGAGGTDSRYVKVTEQFRRMPVAIVMIVDQDHVDRVLTTFQNSKLRFLQTQVLLNHYAGSMQPPPPTERMESGGADKPNKIFKALIDPKSGPAVPKTPGRQAERGGSGDLETNMELVLYGVVTIYQRYPPKGDGAKKQ